MCIIMCALHHARTMCITHYASLHKHHKFMCISITCSCAYTSYYMHLIMSSIMSTIPLMHNSSICINIVSMSHWCTTYPVKSHCTTNGMKNVANTHKISDMCRCLNLSTSMGGTRSKVEGGDLHDLEPEGMRKDTRHKIYTGSGSQSSYPTSCLE
jgi:hypothetical protein